MTTLGPPLYTFLYSRNPRQIDNYSNLVNHKPTNGNHTIAKWLHYSSKSFRLSTIERTGVCPDYAMDQMISMADFDDRVTAATAPSRTDERTINAPITQKEAAEKLGCSPALIRKRLTILRSLHPQTALTEPNGAVTPTGFQAIARLGEIGLAAYRAEAERQAQQQTAARQQTEIPPATTTVIPEIVSDGEGAIAIADDLATARALLEQRRASIRVRQQELQHRGHQRDRDLANLVATARDLQREQQNLQQLELLETARDAAADIARKTLCATIADFFAAASGPSEAC